MPLEEYRRKRNFGRTPEPAGDLAAPGTAATPASSGRFVVQRHRATRLHYDFRLEIDGVLVSWAVPRGPTIDAGARRMAVHVEDHPIEYLDFEGVIPKGQYGAGDVIVWDWGTWGAEAETPDGRRAIADGELKFRLEGQKVRGRFTIVRTSGRSGRAFEDDEGDQWLLIHKRDEHSVKGWDAEDHPQSVKTGRTNDEVLENRDAVWVSEAPAASAEIDLRSAIPSPMPAWIEPMAATLTDKAFRDEDWLFEVKWDGYRLQAVVKDGRVRTFTRNGKDGDTYFPKLLVPPTWIDAREAIVDGEVIAINEDGLPEFSLLQERLGGKGPGSGASGGLVFQAFDVLYLDGRSLLRVPLEDRKRLLKSVIREDGRVRYARHVDTEGVAFLEACAAQGLEGAIAKHRRSVYEPGIRSRAWLKLKIRPEQELVVGGWTPGEGNAKDLGALVVGFYEADGDDPDAPRKLHFAGKIGAGFTARTRADLRSRLEALETPTPPFATPPPKDYRGRWGGDLAKVVWTRPELVIRAELGGWTREGIVRQGAFKGVEVGKDPLDVTRERAVETRATVSAVEAELPPEAGDASEGSVAVPAKGGPRVASRSLGAAAAKGGDRVADNGAVKGSAKATAKRSTKGTSADAHLHPWAATDAELAALAALGKEGTWRVGGVDLKLTNLDKPLFPPSEGDAGGPVAKRELIAYFARIAPVMLPHLAERPLNLHRFPNGPDGPGFWQKDLKPTDPSWLRRWREVGVEAREANEHLVADRVATLAWLANQAAFEVHAWTSRLEEPFRPTFALIDIDPGTKTTWEETLTIARLYRTALGHLGVRGYPKVTGQRGIQVWVPIVPKYDHGQTTDWVEKVSRAVGAVVPDLVSWEWAKGNRGGKARLDYTQNSPIKTLVAPYAVRPAAGGPVSAPITWDELDDPALRPNRWTIRTMLDRVAAVGDLFAEAQTDLQELPPV